MRLGVSGRRIHVVHPPEDNPTSCLPNGSVKHAVKQALEKEEVHVHHDCLLTQINDGRHTDPVTSVTFTTDAQTLRLECVVFFCFSHKTIDYDAFKAINDACLVFDGRFGHRFQLPHQRPLHIRRRPPDQILPPLPCRPVERLLL